MENEGVAFILGMVVAIVGVLLLGFVTSLLDDIQVNDLDALLRVPVYVVTVDGETFVCTTAPGITAKKVVLHNCNFIKSNRAAYVGYSSIKVETRMPEGGE